MQPRFSRRTRLGFTLLELIVTVVILGVLAALAVPALSAVQARSALEVEEAGLAAIARAAYAHARLGDPSATSYTAEDLEAVTASDQAAESLQLRRPGRQIRTGLGGFSTTSQVIHGSIRPDGSVGLAVYVPQAAACAYGHAAAPSRGLAVETWSVRGAAVFECAGNVAAGGPSGAAIGLLMPPPTPTGLTLTLTTVSWDVDPSVDEWDVWCAGEHLGSTTDTSFDVGDCDPDDVLVSARASGQVGTDVPGWDGGPSSYDPAPRTISGGDADTATASGAGAISIAWDTSGTSSTTTYTIERSTDGGSAWQTVTATASGGRYIDRNAPTGTSVRYRAVGPDGPVATTATTPVAPTSPTASSSDGQTSGDGWLSADLVGTTATLTWLPVDDTPQAPLDGYRLYRATSPADDWSTATRVYDGTSTSYVDADLGDGPWCWRVSAYGPGGESGLSDPACGEVLPDAKAQFAYTGADQSFTVPDGVTRIAVTAYGAGPSNGGRGARVNATLPVTPGEVLTVRVGGFGFNGGGAGGPATGGSPGSHGGDASDLRRGGTALTDRILVAGGGGGKGGSSSVSAPDADGGALLGAGYHGGTSISGHGGTQTSGGAKGVGSYDRATSGRLGQGGSGGGSTLSSTANRGGGGGGGGYYGGGGGDYAYFGSGGNGGGGSSWVTPDALSSASQTGARVGYGEVGISW